MFAPKHTLKAVVQDLAIGLETGSIDLRRQNAKGEQPPARDSTSTPAYSLMQRRRAAKYPEAFLHFHSTSQYEEARYLLERAFSKQDVRNSADTLLRSQTLTVELADRVLDHFTALSRSQYSGYIRHAIIYRQFRVAGLTIAAITAFIGSYIATHGHLVLGAAATIITLSSLALLGWEDRFERQSRAEFERSAERLREVELLRLLLKETMFSASPSSAHKAPVYNIDAIIEMLGKGLHGVDIDTILDELTRELRNRPVGE